MGSSVAKVSPRGELRGPRDVKLGGLGAAGACPSVLAFHGFGGTPLEVELVVDVARELGLRAEAPLLPGHGTHARDLSRTGWSDWTSAARAAYRQMPAPLIAVGFSMGSLLAIDLAAEHPKEIVGLVLISNATRLTSPFPNWALALADWLRLPDFLAPKGRSDLGDEAARAAHVSYDSHPVHAAIEVLHAGARARELLPSVKCPTLILHGARDRVCPVANAWRVAQALGTDDSRVVIFPRSRHILTRDLERAQVRRELETFLSAGKQAVLGAASLRPGSGPRDRV